MDPCGTICDMLRSCYATDMRFSSNPLAPLVRVQWFFVDDIRPLPPPNPYYSRFGSGNWAYFKTGPFPGPGEVSSLPSERPWKNGRRVRPVPPRGAIPCGRAEWWAQGVPWPWTAPHVNPDGSIGCCNRRVLNVGNALGVDMGLSSDAGLGLAVDVGSTSDVGLSLAVTLNDAWKSLVCPSLPSVLKLTVPPWRPDIIGPQIDKPPSGDFPVFLLDNGTHYQSNPFTLSGMEYVFDVRPVVSTFPGPRWACEVLNVPGTGPSSKWSMFGGSGFPVICGMPWSGSWPEFFPNPDIGWDPELSTFFGLDVY